MSTILVPTDFSKFADAALQEALVLAKADGSELVLLHVVEETEYPLHQVLKAQGFPNVRDEVHKAVMEQLGQVQGRMGDVKSRILVKDGTPSAEIADTALEVNAHLIVMASHGVTGVKRFLLGSTTERVVRIAPCSVLVVRHPED